MLDKCLYLIFNPMKLKSYYYHYYYYYYMMFKRLDQVLYSYYVIKFLLRPKIKKNCLFAVPLPVHF